MKIKCEVELTIPGVHCLNIAWVKEAISQYLFDKGMRGEIKIKRVRI